eukprot:TRINITY_DN2602_c0_g1_i2.p1 TRINITY_DN2602_c0_g1~~TRINITY_DN2602_c0_g1_i2.p1  ORF type:complete len:255 (-),score=-4.48 TRINITY_DN2602_c0_g1_i2:140-904(-)
MSLGMSIVFVILALNVLVLIICIFRMDPKDTSIITACYKNIISCSFVADIFNSLLGRSDFLKGFALLSSILPCITFIASYFQISDDLCAKYYKTAFYLRILMIMFFFALPIFVMLAINFLLKILLKCCQTFCPSIIRRFPFLIVLNNWLHGKKSLTATELIVSNAIPRIKFDPDIHTNEKECSICIKEFVEDDEIIELPCDRRHYFHVTCIMDWVEKAKKALCPICRKDMVRGLIMKQKRDKNEYSIGNVAINV